MNRIHVLSLVVRLQSRVRAKLFSARRAERVPAIGAPPSVRSDQSWGSKPMAENKKVRATAYALPVRAPDFYCAAVDAAAVCERVCVCVLHALCKISESGSARPTGKDVPRN